LVAAALSAFREATAASPTNVRALIEAAQAMAARFEIAEAERYLSLAEELVGDDPQVVPAIAHAYRLSHRPLASLRLLERLAGSGNLPAPRWGELAVLYEQTNRPQAALAAIETCITLAPEQPEPRLVQARLLLNALQNERAERVLNSLCARSDLSPILLARAYLETARLRDSWHDYAGAMAALEKAKGIQQSDPMVGALQARSTAVTAAFQQLYQQLDERVFRRWQVSAERSDLPCSAAAFLLSFPRSGTTLLERLLDRHPRLLAAPERTVFAREIFPQLCRDGDSSKLDFAMLDGCDRERLHEARQRYFACHRAIHGQLPADCVHMDKNPNLTSLLIGVLRVFPESKLVYALRDPRDVLVSAYSQFWPMTEYSVAFLSWEDACERYAAEMQIWLQLRKWLPQWLEVKYEDVVSDPDQQCARVWDFLALETPKELPTVDEHTVVNSPTAVAVRQPVHQRSAGRWRNYETWLRPFLDRLMPYCREFGYE
jgi:tetratricopeptide (TPR) repeat protein